MRPVIVVITPMPWISTRSSRSCPRTCPGLRCPEATLSCSAPGEKD